MKRGTFVGRPSIWNDDQLPELVLMLLEAIREDMRRNPAHYPRLPAPAEPSPTAPPAQLERKT